MELLFRRLYPRLCAFANRYVNSMDDAEDLVQEVFYKVWKSRSFLDENKSFSTYLFSAVKNSALNFLERKKHESKYAEVMSLVYMHERNDDIVETLVAKDLEQDFNKALDHLPESCRKILLQYVMYL